MSASYLLRRIGVFLLIAWLAATLNFFLPRLTGQDPVRVKLLQQAQLGGHVQAGIDEMVKEYDRRFGLDRPLWAQYLTFLGNAARLDFNYSIANYPRTVNAMIAEALPWTVAPPGHHDRHLVRPRHLPRRAAGLAPGPALDAAG